MGSGVEEKNAEGIEQDCRPGRAASQCATRNLNDEPETSVRDASSAPTWWAQAGTYVGRGVTRRTSRVQKARVSEEEGRERESSGRLT